MKVVHNPWQQNNFIPLKNNDYLEKNRISGKIVAEVLSLLENEIINRTKLSMIELDALVEQYILSHNCIPTFKGYKGFPAATCISINKCLVHGIPTDYHLQNGDIVSFDLGATYKGVIADAARTFIYGEPKNEQHSLLVRTTKEALSKAIEAIKIGKRLGCIGNTIYKFVRSKGFSVVETYGGHSCTAENGIGNPHTHPFVSNRADINEGIRFTNNLVLCIEPLVVIGGSNRTIVKKDGWSVETDDISAHEENTIFIHDDCIEILTDSNNYKGYD
jgi:methionyl aminopeptidase